MNPGDIVAIATGTAGLTAFLIYAVRLLWVSHEKQDVDVRAQREAALGDSRAQTIAIVRLSNAVEKLTDEVRRRTKT